MILQVEDLVVGIVESFQNLELLHIKVKNSTSSWVESNAIIAFVPTRILVNGLSYSPYQVDNHFINESIVGRQIIVFIRSINNGIYSGELMKAPVLNGMVINVVNAEHEFPASSIDAA